MQEDYGKLWYQDVSNKLGINRALDVMNDSGLSLPCKVVAVNGSIVTVTFLIRNAGALPNVTIPKAESPYFRMPTQVGDTGIVISSDTILSNVSGLSSDVPDFNKTYGNLSRLIFVPVSNQGAPPTNQTQAIAESSGGVLLQTSDGNVSLSLTSSGVTIKIGSTTWSFTGSGLTLSNNVVAETHVHLYTPGTGTPTDTGGPLAG
jgi:hypothetical protein